VISRLFPRQILHDHDTSAIKQVSFADAQAIAADIIDRYSTDGIDVVHLFYARFRSALVQEPVGQQIIPVPLGEAEAAPAGGVSAAVEYEPDEEDILASLLPRTSRSRSSAPCSRTPPPNKAAA
jgi:F-type H+-transporting ATPase subunit gamma